MSAKKKIMTHMDFFLLLKKTVLVEKTEMYTAITYKFFLTYI